MNHGGAEQLLLRHYGYLKLNNNCRIITFKNNLFKKNEIDIIEVKNLLGLIFYLCKNRFHKIYASSGHIEIFIASLFSFSKYSYFIHQPSTMSFNEFDKYAFKNLEKLRFLINERYYILFKRIKKKIKYIDQIKINFRYILSKYALKYASSTFVLSSFAKLEKKILYNINSNHICGAISKIYPLKLKKDNRDKIKIISLSRLDRNKRLDKIIKAIKILDNKNIHLDIYGIGYEFKNLSNLISRLDLNNQINLKGFLDDNLKSNVFEDYDFCICIDFADFRITSIESINFSCPVIISNDSSMSDVNKYNFLFFCDPTIKGIVNFFTKLNEIKIDWSDREYFLEKYLWGDYFRFIDENSIQN